MSNPMKRRIFYNEFRLQCPRILSSTKIPTARTQYQEKVFLLSSVQIARWRCETLEINDWKRKVKKFNVYRYRGYHPQFSEGVSCCRPVYLGEYARQKGKGRFTVCTENRLS